MNRWGWAATFLGVAAWTALCVYLAVANGTGAC